MKEAFSDSSPIFGNRICLGVMSSMAMSKEASFADLKQWLAATDNRLWLHLQALEKNGFLLEQKKGLWQKMATIYSITPAGEKAILEHLQHLEMIVKRLS